MIQLILNKQKALYVLFTLLSLLFFAGAAHAQNLSANVDRSTVSEDESLTLKVRYTGDTNSQPDFSQLSEQFEIVNQYQNSRIHSINGRVEAFTEWTLVIIPRHQGKLIIPSFKFNGEYSEAIEINVAASAPMPAGTKDVVFMETHISDTALYVQQQVRLSYRFFYSVNVDALDRPELLIDGVIVEPLEETSYRRNINGVTYHVAEFNFALFPQNSGTVTIPSQRWTAKLGQNTRSSLFGLQGGRYDLKRVNTDEIVLQIKPKPASFPANATWLPSAKVQLEESWNKDPDSFKVGEPITRNVQLKALGLTSSQLPNIVGASTDPSLKYYPDQPALADQKDVNTFIGVRTETLAIVVSEGGEITIPAIRIPWWNTETDSLQYAELPQRRFIVAASDKIRQSIESRNEAIAEASSKDFPQQVIASQQAEPSSPLVTILAAVSSLLACLFCYLWLSTRSQLSSLESKQNRSQATIQKAAQSEKKAWKAFETACERNDLPVVRESLLYWANTRWPVNKIYSLSDFARTLEAKEVASELQSLDNALYAKDAAQHWNANTLKVAIESALKIDKKGAEKYKLKPLYA